MAKNIVLCSDGTGQAGGQGSVSNVWRLFKAVDRHNDGTVQVAFHVDGVGTESNKYFRAFSGAFGWGLSKDICMLYASLVRSYKPCDRIFLFGFSRGAFTVRSLAGMIHQIGILKNDQFKSDTEIDDAVAAAYRSYRKDEKSDLSGTYEIHKKRDIEFVGVWDTVDAIGVPIDKMRDAIYAIAKFWRRPHKDGLNTSIKKACHAISIDDERQTFHPKIWDETGFEGKVEQVWFAGVHSNVGGGYPKDSLSYIPLDWIMKKAQERGLQFLSSKWVAGLKPGKPFGDIQEQADKHGRIYDSRGGAAIYYRYKPRNIEKLWSEAQTGNTLPTIHESVLKRIESGYTGYAPTAIQGSFKWVDTWIGKNGTVHSGPGLGKA